MSNDAMDHKPGPPPGRAAYHRGCRCAACRKAAADYARRRRRRLNAGIQQHRPLQAHQHIDYLLKSGLTQNAIATAAGLSAATVNRVTSGRAKWLYHETHTAILSVTTAATPRDRNMPTRHLKPLLAELVRAGFTQVRIARIIGIKRSRIHLHRWAQPKTADRIITLYRLAARQGLVRADLLEEVLP